MTFRGRVKQVGADYFAEVLESPRSGRYKPGALIALGLIPERTSGIHVFTIADGKAYPSRGLVRAAATLGGPRGVAIVQQPAEVRWAWQKEALAKWTAAGCHGIVEAVTGSGKTFLAMEAWRRVLERHRDTYTLVVVPSILLQEQWHDRLSTHYPQTRIAKLGGGHLDTFAAGKICVAVINSVVGVGRRAHEARLLSLFDHCRRFRENRSFLIADECHHYINAEIFSRVRTLVRYNAVLALSATVGETFAVEGLGSIVYSYTFADAIRRGDLPPLTLLNVRCELQSDERRKYDDLTERIRDSIAFIERAFEEELDEDDTSDDFWQRLRRIDQAAGPDGEPAVRKLMVLFFRRAEVVYCAQAKQQAARDLIRTLLASNSSKLIVFFERIESAEDGASGMEDEAAEDLRDAVATRELWTGVLHSGLDSTSRRRVIEEFRRTSRGVLFACRMLDEGFDVPDVDAAVLVASTRSKRQRVQRIGRVLRRGDGNKQPIVLTLFCDQTTDRFVVNQDRVLFGDDTEIATLSPGDTRKFLQKRC